MDGAARPKPVSLAGRPSHGLISWSGRSGAASPPQSLNIPPDRELFMVCLSLTTAFVNLDGNRESVERHPELIALDQYRNKVSVTIQTAQLVAVQQRLPTAMSVRETDLVRKARIKDAAKPYLVLRRH